MKHYVAGAPNARTCQLVWIDHRAKNITVFVNLLDALRKIYRRARRIIFVLDSYIIHKTEIVRPWLANNPKFELLFQPAYHPWVNQIERLWEAMHGTVTRNHAHSSIFDLCHDVKRFFDVV